MPATPDRRETGPQEELLAWARHFIEVLSKGGHPDRHSLEDLSVEQHEVLAHVASEALTHRRSTIRRAAAWVVGAADVFTDDAPLLLCRLLHDRVALVRTAAAWACAELGADARTTIASLIEALKDPDDGVRFAAAGALGKLGEVAMLATEPLLEIATSKDEKRIRDMALKALADIAPDHPTVQHLMIQSLDGAGADRRYWATYGLTQADSSAEEAVSRLTANVEAADPYLVQLSVWAIGKLGTSGERATPAMLAAMKRLHWLHIEYSELPGEEFISIRTTFCEALAGVLSGTDDPDYADFRLRLFSAVFHPTPLEQTGWIDEIVNHRWYLKLQRRRFGHPASTAERQALRQMVCDAQTKFATRLWKNPTLGLRPETYRLLPGFIKNHCRNIAWRLQEQQWKPRKKKVVSDDTDPFAAQAAAAGSAEEVARRLCEFIETYLPEEERAVARCRWVLKYTIAETASFLKLTPSQVKTRERRARATAERHYQQGSL